ncbi:hypothetical protein KDK77_03455 [bacterium]|nr:hypothetical protein [bacterium]MCP5463277.1 hypothetical protein [bacterium]
MTYININRPIYLALRDKCYLKAINHLYEDFLEWPTVECHKKLDCIIKLFQKTSENAVFALRGEKKNPHEENFIHCISLIVDYLRAAYSMIHHALLLEEGKSFLHQFLRENIANVNKDVDSSKRVAEQVVERLKELVVKVTDTFETLRNYNFNNLPDDQKKRYHRIFSEENSSQ